MATIYSFDGFDDSPTAQLLREYVRLANDVTVVAGGRNGGNRLRCYGTATGSAYAGIVRAVGDGTLTKITMGAYCHVVSLAAQRAIMDFRDSTSSNVIITVNTDGSISAHRASTVAGANLSDFSAGSYAATLGTSAAGIVQADVPFSIVATVVCSDAAGEVEIIIDGDLILDLSGVDTKVGGGYLTNVCFGLRPASGSTISYWDDCYWSDVSYGDQRVDSHYPVSDGANQDGSGSASGNHFDLVDEASPDDDATYVTLAAAGERESYGCTNFINTGAPINAAMVVLDAKKTDAGGATLATHIRQSGTDYDGTAQGLIVDYGRIWQVYQTDPGSGSPETAFDEAGFNAAEFGYKKVA